MILLQSNIWKEYGYDRLTQSIADRNLAMQMVDLIPFTDQFQQTVDGIPSVVFGSNRFVNVCRVKGYPTFKTFDPIETVYPKPFWVNGNGQWVKWKDLNVDSPKFIKPKTEKFFTGLVVESRADLDKVQLATSFIENEDEELIWVADPVNIGREIRFFVVKGSGIVTASQYKDRGHVAHKRVERAFEQQAWDFVNDLLWDYGFVDQAFVIDVGQVAPDRWKIVELNNFNSSGLYECDTDAIVSSLDL